MSIYRSLIDLAAEWRAERDEARTLRMIGSLPREIQKDIGWPDVHVSRKANFATGSWAGGK